MQLNGFKCAITASLLIQLASSVQAQELVERTELHRADLAGVPDMEVVVARLVIQPGGTVPLHTHPGDEHLLVQQGGTAVTHDGKQVSFPDGIATSFPRGEVHGGLTVTGQSPFILNTVHIVDKGKPLVEPVQ